MIVTYALLHRLVMLLIVSHLGRQKLRLRLGWGEQGVVATLKLIVVMAAHHEGPSLAQLLVGRLLGSLLTRFVITATIVDHHNLLGVIVVVATVLDVRQNTAQIISDRKWSRDDTFLL